MRTIAELEQCTIAPKIQCDRQTPSPAQLLQLAAEIQDTHAELEGYWDVLAIAVMSYESETITASDMNYLDVIYYFYLNTDWYFTGVAAYYKLTQQEKVIALLLLAEIAESELQSWITGKKQ